MMQLPPGLLSDDEQRSIRATSLLGAGLALLGNRAGGGLAGAANAAAQGLGAYGQTYGAGVNNALQMRQLQEQMQARQAQQQQAQQLGQMFSEAGTPQAKAEAYIKAANLAAAQGNSEAAKRYADIAQSLMPKEREGFTLSEGQQRFDANGNPVASVAAKPAAAPAAVQEYEFARSQGFRGSFAEWELAKRRAGANSVNVTMGAENAFAKKGAELQAQGFSELANQGNQSNRSMVQINRLGELLSKTGGGFGTAAKATLGQYGVKTEGLDDIQAAQALINTLIPLQRPAGSGTMSDRDVELFRQSVPNLMNQPGGNERIISTMRSIAQYDAQVGRIAADALNGRITREEADSRISRIQNPLAGFGQPSPMLDQARDAIRRGAPRDAVIRRLQEHGINPEGL